LILVASDVADVLNEFLALDFVQGILLKLFAHVCFFVLHAQRFLHVMGLACSHSFLHV
jgi:hypothetical protein